MSKSSFIFLESASKEEQPVQEAIDYCVNSKNDIQLFIIKSIDRFTRGGSYLYDGLKMQLERKGVKLIDIYGVIGTQQINTLEHLGVSFDWSVYSPTKKSEILEAERAKDEMPRYYVKNDWSRNSATPEWVIGSEKHHTVL